MSKITGGPDFKDFLDKYGIPFVKKLNIYIGYYNYIFDTAVDTTDLNTMKDWAFLFHYCILSKSIHEKLGCGYVVLYDRDYFSLQDDLLAWNGNNKKTEKGRKRFAEILKELSIEDKEIDRIVIYHYELEDKTDGRKDVH